MQTSLGLMHDDNRRVFNFQQGFCSTAKMLCQKLLNSGVEVKLVWWTSKAMPFIFVQIILC